MKTFIFGLILGGYSQCKLSNINYIAQLYSSFITSLYIQIVYNSVLVNPYAILGGEEKQFAIGKP